MFYPSVSETKEYLKSYGIVPMFYELLTDRFTPVRMFSILKENYEIKHDGTQCKKDG